MINIYSKYEMIIENERSTLVDKFTDEFEIDKEIIKHTYDGYDVMKYIYYQLSDRNVDSFDVVKKNEHECVISFTFFDVRYGESCKKVINIKEIL